MQKWLIPGQITSSHCMWPWELLVKIQRPKLYMIVGMLVLSLMLLSVLQQLKVDPTYSQIPYILFTVGLICIIIKITNTLFESIKKCILCVFVYHLVSKGLYGLVPIWQQAQSISFHLFLLIQLWKFIFLIFNSSIDVSYLIFSGLVGNNTSEKRITKLVQCVIPLTSSSFMDESCSQYFIGEEYINAILSFLFSPMVYIDLEMNNPIF